MRQGPAFRFIPELIGGITHIMTISRGPQLYIETGMETLHMASNVFQAIIEHSNTKSKEQTLKTIRETYKEIELKKLDAQYEKIKQSIKAEQFASETVVEFSSTMHAMIRKYISCLNQLQSGTDYTKRSQVEENIRKAINSYYKMMKEII